MTFIHRPMWDGGSAPSTTLFDEYTRDIDRSSMFGLRNPNEQISERARVVLRDHKLSPAELNAADIAASERFGD